MKKLFGFLLIFVFLSCTKQDMKPSDTQADWHKQRHEFEWNRNRTESFITTYSGTDDNTFSITFPAVSNVLSWHMEITRRVTGTVTLTNMLNVVNDSTINIMRVMQVLCLGNVICDIPYCAGMCVKQKLKANQTTIQQLNCTITDTLGGTGQPDTVYGIRDLIAPFKANCTNSANLHTDYTITMTYTFRRQD